MKRVCLILGFVTGIVLSSRPTAAQYTADFQTNIISGVTNSGMSSYYVGRTNFADVLLIRNKGALFSYRGYVGYSSSSSNNSVLVTDSGSVWTNTDSGGRNLLYVGYNGAANSLVIINGGRVSNGDGYLGYNSSSSSNTALVAGIGSLWNNAGTLYVGWNGADNTLTVTGGTVSASQMIVGGAGTASNNVVRIDDGNLIVTNFYHNGSLVVGQDGQGKLILNAGTITAEKLIVTSGANSGLLFNGGCFRSGNTTVSNNSLLAVGDGTNNATFYLAGGTHSFADGLWIRTNAQLVGCGVVNGGVLVDGTVLADCGRMSIFTGAVTNYGRIEVKNGTYLVFPAPMVNYGLIVATNGAVRYCSTFENYGTLLGDVQDGANAWVNPTAGRWEDGVNWSGGTPTNDQWCLITNAVSKTVTIDAATASGHPNSLSIISLTLGAPLGLTNALTIENSGTVTPLQIANSLAVGSGGRLVVSNAVVNVSRLTEGNLAIDGELLLSAATLTVTNGAASVGDSGSGQMLVSNSTVRTREAFVGRLSGASGLLTVTGIGSVWNDQGVFEVGHEGYANNLVITNGGQVVNPEGRVGGSSISSNNSVRVSGSGSVWNSSSLFVGYSGSDNSLVISSSGTVYSTSGYIGNNTTAADNSVRVTGTGSVWNGGTYLYVGYSGPSNRLEISRGGRAVSYFADVGLQESSSNNSVLVTDPGSVCYFPFLSVGYASSGNSLVISNGGFVTSYAQVEVGGTDSGSNNKVLVTGSGSVWQQTDRSLLLGDNGAGNSMVISDGGQVSIRYGFVGHYPSSSNTSVLVTGPGSVWGTSYDLYFGYSGAGNALVISNGGQVANGWTGYVGYDSSSSNNSVLVTGPSSVWSSGDLYFGNSGAGNSLVAIDQGQIVNANGYVGYSSSSSNNSVRVANGAVWRNNTLHVGEQGSSNSLLVAGGSVLATNLTIGFASARCDNLVQLDSGSIVVTNAGHNAALEVGNGKLILNGGVLQVDRFVMTNLCAQFVRTGGALIYGTAVLDPNASAVGDGIPNWWKQKYGLDPLDPSVANADPDGDGMTNLEEYQAGTDPTNSASVFRITEIWPEDEDMFLTWTAVGGKRYALQTTTGFTGSLSNDFIDLNPAIVAPGTGETEVSVLHLGAATNAPARFYRVRLVP